MYPHKRDTKGRFHIDGQEDTDRRGESSETKEIQIKMMQPNTSQRVTAVTRSCERQGTHFSRASKGSTMLISSVLSHWFCNNLLQQP